MSWTFDSIGFIQCCTFNMYVVGSILVHLPRCRAQSEMARPFSFAAVMVVYRPVLLVDNALQSNE